MSYLSFSSTWDTAKEIEWLRSLRDDRRQTRHEKYRAQLAVLDARHLDGKGMSMDRAAIRAELLRLIAETS